MPWLSEAMKDVISCDKRVGKQTRWSAAKVKQMRRRSEIDMEKYNQIVVSDDNSAEHEYKSDYRGRVQNRVAGNWKPNMRLCLGASAIRTNLYLFLRYL
jgi:hypothetical protein